jgi:hypothetical protein
MQVVVAAFQRTRAHDQPSAPPMAWANQRRRALLGAKVRWKAKPVDSGACALLVCATRIALERTMGVSGAAKHVQNRAGLG